MAHGDGSIKHILAVLAGLVIVSACGVGLWIAARSSLQPLIVPGAQAVQVAQPSLMEQVISYHAPGAPYAWYLTVSRTLASMGWRSPARYLGGPPADPDSYFRSSSLWFVVVWEHVELHGGPYDAQITVQRWITIRWPSIVGA